MAFLLVLTTAPSRREARKIAETLLDKRLAACVTLSGPVESRYRWQGRKEKTSEYALWIKTSAALYSRIEKTIRQIHSYQVPEILALSVKRGSPAYLRWMAGELKKGGK